MKQIIRELLEQYEKDMDMPQFAVQYYTDEYIISKHYGFIKWLVDNDKIDIDKYYEFMTNENIDISNACWELDMDKEFYYELLMILAVQDNPIEFLISILK